MTAALLALQDGKDCIDLLTRSSRVHRCIAQHQEVCDCRLTVWPEQRVHGAQKQGAEASAELELQVPT